MLQIKNLSKSYGAKKAVSNLSFVVEDGDIMGFIGKNGAGKTTTLKACLGMGFPFYLIVLGITIIFPVIPGLLGTMIGTQIYRILKEYNMVGLLSGLFNVTVCVVFPIAIFLIILTRSKNAKTELKVFLVGVCTYLVAQILFRQPFLALLQSIDSYRILITTNRVAHIAILAVTAAIAEEIGRYIAFRFFVKGQSAQNTPLYFGLGHGGIEALSVGVNSVILLVCSPYTLINMGYDKTGSKTDTLLFNLSQCPALEPFLYFLVISSSVTWAVSGWI